MNGDLDGGSGSLYSVKGRTRKTKKVYPDGSQKILPSDSMDLDAVVNKTKKSSPTPEKFSPTPEKSSSTPEKSSPTPEKCHSHCTDSNKSSKKWSRIRLILLIALLIALGFIVATSLTLIIALVQISDLRSDVMLLKSTSPATIVNSFSSLNNVMLDSTLVSNVTSQLSVFMDMILTNVTERSNKIQQNIESLSDILDDIVDLTLTQTFHSCADVQQLYPSFPSGYYRVRSSEDSAMTVYCDMSRSCGNTTGGWMRVALLDMRYKTTRCPSGFTENTNLNVRTCIQTRTGSDCSALNYSTNGIMYSQVCGMIRGYQVRYPDGFSIRGIRPIFPTPGDNYVDGVSLTHGSRTKHHIWSFAASTVCNCSINRPSFVGDHFSCDGVPFPNCPNFCGTVLWDGDGCQYNNSPWFYRQLIDSTTDNIDLRLCRDEPQYDEDIAIEVIEILVH